MKGLHQKNKPPYKAHGRFIQTRLHHTNLEPPMPFMKSKTASKESLPGYNTNHYVFTSAIDELHKVETPYHDNDMILTLIIITTKWLAVSLKLSGTSHGWF
jgi:hypothetical protein